MVVALAAQRVAGRPVAQEGAAQLGRQAAVQRERHRRHVGLQALEAHLPGVFGAVAVEGGLPVVGPEGVSAGGRRERMRANGQQGQAGRAGQASQEVAAFHGGLLRGRAAQRSVMAVVVSPWTSITASSKAAGPMRPRASRLKPVRSVGTPTTLLSTFSLPFSSWKADRA